VYYNKHELFWTLLIGIRTRDRPACSKRGSVVLQAGRVPAAHAGCVVCFVVASFRFCSFTRADCVTETWLLSLSRKQITELLQLLFLKQILHSDKLLLIITVNFVKEYY
jgi:hypothetical protein